MRADSSTEYMYVLSARNNAHAASVLVGIVLRELHVTNPPAAEARLKGSVELVMCHVPPSPVVDLPAVEPSINAFILIFFRNKSCV